MNDTNTELLLLIVNFRHQRRKDVTLHIFF